MTVVGENLFQSPLRLGEIIMKETILFLEKIHSMLHFSEDFYSALLIAAKKESASEKEYNSITFCDNRKFSVAERDILVALQIVVSANKALKSYREQNLADSLFCATFSDIERWAKTCFDWYGHWGITVENWFKRHLELNLFAFGRLQFIPVYPELPQVTDFEHSAICGFNSGCSAIDGRKLFLDVHIPLGKKLTKDDCLYSMSQALEFFRLRYPDETIYGFVCRSWLFATELQDLLPLSSGIREFTALFDVYPVWPNEKNDLTQSIERLFGTKEIPPPSDRNKYPSRLQQGALDYLYSGRTLGQRQGVRWI